MISRLLKPSAILLILTFSYLQNLYAFSPALSCPINPAFNASPRFQLPLETTQVTTFTYTKEGTSLGLDPRISSLIGAPISGAIGAGLTGGANVGQNIISSINQGILRGATSLGIEYLTQQADLDPLLGSLTSRAITGAISGALKDAISSHGPINQDNLHSAVKRVTGQIQTYNHGLKKKVT